MAKRNVVPVDLGGKRTNLSMAPDAKAIVTELAKTLGMKEIAVVSRIYLWFAQQDEVVQKGVLGLLPRGYEADVVQLALNRLAPAASPTKK